MEVIVTSDPKLVSRTPPYIDERGIFSRLIESPTEFPTYQLNTSINFQKGIFRGLHLLRGKHSENKKVTVLTGEILDLVINLDFNSKKYGNVYEYKLTEESESLLIPPLHAHGFLTISEIAVVAYQVDKPYVPHADAGVNIEGLKLKTSVLSEITNISNKDSKLPFFSKSYDMEFSKCEFC